MGGAIGKCQHKGKNHATIRHARILSYLSPPSLEGLEIKLCYFSAADTQAKKTKLIWL